MSWEFDILYALQGIHHPILDQIMILLSTLGDAGLFWIALGCILLVVPKYRRVGLEMLAAMLFTFIIGNLILKNVVHRDRPCWIDPSVTLLVKCPTDYSFPSGHTMNGITASVSLFLNDRRMGIPAVVLASLIAFSRLYNFVHFPTDVFAGALIGLCSAYVVDWFFQRKRTSFF